MVRSFVAKQISLDRECRCHASVNNRVGAFSCRDKRVQAFGIDSMDLYLGAGEDPGRFACFKLTGAPFYDRGRSKSGDRPAGAALERLPRLHRAGGRILVHSKVKKEISSEIEKTTLSESFLMLF